MKAYVKPELFYERYELSQHIADCAWELTQADGACHAVADKGKIPSDELLFTTSLPLCTATTDDGVYNDFCYQGGDAHANVFMS